MNNVVFVAESLSAGSKILDQICFQCWGAAAEVGNTLVSTFIVLLNSQFQAQWLYHETRR